MKNLILLSILSFFSIPIVAQTEIPDFEFKLYITNPDGDKDSLCLGDVLREKLILDTAYGEYDISHLPFHSTLDIRSMFSLEFDYHYKKYITRYNCDSMAPLLPPKGYPTGFPIGFYSRSYPVILSWDREKFLLDTCRDSSFITRINYGTFDFFDERLLPKLEARLSETSQLVLDKDYLEKSNYRAWARTNYYETKLNNGDSGVIYMIYIGITNQPLRILIDTENPQSQGDIKLYPNPAFEYIHIEHHEEFNIRQFVVFDLNGKKIKTVHTNPEADQIKIPILDFPPGIYVVMPLDRSWQRRFIKE